MPEMIRGLLVIALLSCGSTSHPPPAAPAAPSDAASPPRSDATPPVDNTPDGLLLRYGKPLEPGQDHYYTCAPTPEQLTACTGACALMPPVKYWDGPLRCSGVARPPPSLLDEKKRLDALAIPRCQCGCDPGYKAAAAAYHDEVLRCSMVP